MVLVFLGNFADANLPPATYGLPQHTEGRAAIQTFARFLVETADVGAVAQGLAQADASPYDALEGDRQRRFHELI
ncbi:MAG: hypothetical protein OXK76_17690 [Gammaproteobacteria bacterium]|nr:hypothetical protein [Gammaproteobacteria bacterium]